MDRRFALLLACFFVSGFAALLYQTAWTRELSFVFGTSELAVAAVLAAYMGGLALGAAAAARFAMRLRRPVLVYGVLELSIAGCALLVPWGIRALNAVYVGLLGGRDAPVDGAASAATAFQLAAAFLVLLPPTALMGATLPLLTRHAVHREEEIGARVGLLYALNTAGAIAGTLLAAFWLIPELGLRRTVWVGAGLNGLVFVLAVALARSAAPTAPVAAAGPSLAIGARWILPAIAISGAVSFAYEVLWTRLLGHLLGASMHAFATMLASFLLGITLGSAVAARFASTRERAILGFAFAQFGIAATSYAAFALADRLPALAASLGAGPESPLASAALAGAALLPITLCIGATFPFAVRILARDSDHAAAATARAYAWNTVGAIAGALGAGFVLLPALGFEGTSRLGIAISLLLAATAALASARRRFAIAGVAVAAVAGALLLVIPAQPPWRLLTSSSVDPNQVDSHIARYAVGRTTTVMLLERNGRYQLTTDGLPESWVDPIGMLPEINVAQWLGALPALVHPAAKDVLVIGLGGGVTLELAPRSYRSVDVIELEPEVLAANRWLSDKRARDPLTDPRTHVFLGDARGMLQLSSKRYDAIVSQPSHPWTAGASHLYTREFFSLVRSRLAPDGVFVQWIGLRFIDEPLLRSLLAALREAFPHVNLFRPRVHGLLFVGSNGPIDVLGAARRALRDAPEDAARLGLHRVEDIVSAWALDEEGVRSLAEGAPPNTDDHNLLAARAARLDQSRLDPESLRALLDPRDPLRDFPELDRSALIRVFTIRGRADRATDLAMASDGAREEAGLGWVELAAGRTGRAARHFDRALQLAPGDIDAIEGSIASRKLELTTGTRLSSVPEAELAARYAALIEGWRRAGARDWNAMAPLEASLAEFAPGDGLYDAAARLRIATRLASGTPEAAAEAQALAETLLARSWSPYDALLRARAAAIAGRPHDAAGSLRRIADRSAPTERGRGLAEKALEVARTLPQEEFAALRADLERRTGRAAPAAGSRRGR